MQCKHCNLVFSCFLPLALAFLPSHPKQEQKVQKDMRGFHYLIRILTLPLGWLVTYTTTLNTLHYTTLYWSAGQMVLTQCERTKEQASERASELPFAVKHAVVLHELSEERRGERRRRSAQEESRRRRRSLAPSCIALNSRQPRP